MASSNSTTRGVCRGWVDKFRFPGSICLGKRSPSHSHRVVWGVSYPTRSTASDRALWSTVLVLYLPMTSGPGAAPARLQHTEVRRRVRRSPVPLQLQQQYVRGPGRAGSGVGQPIVARHVRELQWLKENLLLPSSSKTNYFFFRFDEICRRSNNIYDTKLVSLNPLLNILLWCL